MKKSISGLVVGTLALALGVIVGAAPAQAADATKLTISGGSGVFGLDPATITGTATAPGVVKFTVGGDIIKGCEAVATTTETPFTAKCAWVPAAPGAAVLGGLLTPSDAAKYAPAEAVPFNVKVGTPVQGVVSPIHIYVDTVLGSGTSGALAPRFGVSCAVSSEFIVGQTIVFRIYANNEDLGGAVMDSKNTAKAYIEIAGVKDPVQMSYGNHSGAAFWTGVLKTGTATGLYNTLGVISFKVSMIAKDTTSIKVLSTKLVPKVVDGVVQRSNGKIVYESMRVYKDAKVTPALKGATGTWQSNFMPNSQLTLFAVPTPKA